MLQILHKYDQANRVLDITLGINNSFRPRDACPIEPVDCNTLFIVEATRCRIMLQAVQNDAADPQFWDRTPLEANGLNDVGTIWQMSQIGRVLAL